MIREAKENDLLSLVILGKKFFESTILNDYSTYDEESIGMMYFIKSEEMGNYAIAFRSINGSPQMVYFQE